MSLFSNEMKAVWVLENVHANRNFSMKEIELLYITASVIQWRKFFPDIPTYMVCTTEVYSYLCDLDIMYLWDHVDQQILSEHDEIDRNAFWACSKLKAMRKISAPFVMLDNDIYMNRPVISKSDFKDYSVMVSHEEYGPGYYLLSDHESMGVLQDRYRPDHTGRSYNVSLLYIKEDSFRDAYSKKAYEWMAALSKKKREDPDFNLHGGHMIFCEQKLLYDMVKDEAKSSRTVISDVFDCKKNSFLSNSDLLSQVDHLGPLKRYIESQPDTYIKKKSDVLSVLKDYHNLKHIFGALKKNDKLKHDHSGKFWLSSRLNPYVKPVASKHSNEGRKNCVVYAVWEEFRYVPYLKYSLLSLLASTDAKKKADILIFVSETICRQTVGCLRGILSEECFVEVKDVKALKYMVPTHPMLLKYERVMMVDSDAFFIGSKNIFANIEEYYSKPGREKNMIMCPDVSSGKEVFWSRKRSLCKGLKDKEYEEFFIQKIGESAFSKMMQEKWWISCITIFTKNAFKEEGYGSFALENFWHRQMCDETVFIAWASKNEYMIDRIEKICRFSDRYEDSDDFCAYHPIVGSNTTSPDNERMISAIEEACSKYFKI
jgi:hypothetical protein